LAAVPLGALAGALVVMAAAGVVVAAALAAAVALAADGDISCLALFLF